MFSKTLFETLFAYQWHTNARLLASAAKLDPSELAENPGYGRGSILDLFFHLLRAGQAWRLGLETGKQLPSQVQPEDFGTLTALEAGFLEEKAAWETLLGSLSAAEIEGEKTLIDRRGNPFIVPRWRILQHLILHGMQHHTEIAQLLTQKGQSPGDIDFIFYRG
jgi:uncharacterized damage-inducible protein DinB